MLLFFAHQPNATHSAEIGKMLVHSSAPPEHRAPSAQRRRRRGTEVRPHPADAGHRKRSAGDLLYRDCGSVPIGGVPDHAFRPKGQLAETTIFYKVLGPHAPVQAPAISAT
jgi:hypothetical protein